MKMMAKAASGKSEDSKEEGKAETISTDKAKVTKGNPD